MNKLIVKEELKIKNLIYEIRGKEVMLDYDLANLYSCKNGTKEINQAVKNNPNKFPERYSWKLTKEEFEDLRSKILTANYSSKSRTTPRVFTEQGVAMLATILKNDYAAEVSIRIMDAFVSMRHYLIENKDIYFSLNNINNKLAIHDDKLKYLFSKFDKKEKLFLPGEIYDAYSNIMDIFNEAKKELIIIDPYADKTLLDMISNLQVDVCLITKAKSKLTSLVIQKYNEQYNNLIIKYDNSFHDRYFIIDKELIYHCGTSINYAGLKTFSINRLDDDFVKNSLMKLVDKLM